ncbi:MAG: sugar transferase [Planctomycetia bacterium]|nr:sugar transferase [Planctomycetia bacterium]
MRGRPPLESGTCRRLALPSCVAVIAFAFLAALVIFLNSRDAPIYSHTHVSRNGKPSRCPKFRAMFVDAEERLKPIPAADPPKREEWGRSKQTKEDLLATRVRNSLRRTNLDQLPRIFKAFHGSMSVVGWRPLPQYHYHRQGESFRLGYPEVTSGIIGLWQVFGTSESDVIRMALLHSWHSRNWSLRQDIAPLLRMLPAVILGPVAIDACPRDRSSRNEALGVGDGRARKGIACSLARRMEDGR